MSENTTEITAPQRKPKSKRLSSLVWIVVLWGFVRLIAEMDGISWERAFPIGITVFGLWPATLFLGLSICAPVFVYQTVLRWAALVAVLSSFFTVLFFDSQSKAMIQVILQQRILVTLVLIGVTIHWVTKGRDR